MGKDETQAGSEFSGGLGAMNMINRKSWVEFRSAGLLWMINTLLHTFGWAIVMEFDDQGQFVEAYPARVKFRGFGPTENEAGYRQVSAYLAENAADLNDEASA